LLYEKQFVKNSNKSKSLWHMPLWGLQYFSILDEVNNYSKYIAEVNFKSRVNLFSHSIVLYNVYPWDGHGFESGQLGTTEVILCRVPCFKIHTNCICLFEGRIIDTWFHANEVCLDISPW
jgi:hypothetical protein